MEHASGFHGRLAGWCYRNCRHRLRKTYAWGRGEPDALLAKAIQSGRMRQLREIHHALHLDSRHLIRNPP
jgi:hypothetical protein